MIRVFVADDHEIVREGLRKLFLTTEDIQLVGEAGDGHVTLRALEETPVDVLVLDLSFPRLSGIEVLRRAHQQHPMMAILVLSMYPEEQYAPRLAELGASGYVSKNKPAQEVLKAIREVAGGGRYFTAGMLPSAGRTETKAPHDSLSAREYQVFTLLLQGKSVSEIASELNVNSSTVSNHVTGIRTKLGAKNLVDIVRYAVRAGLIDEGPAEA